MRNLDEEIGTITHEEAEQLALVMIDKCFNNPEKPGRRWQASIPVSAQDTDVRLMAYIKQQKARGIPPGDGLGYATCAGSYQGNIRDLIHRLEVSVAEEQDSALPRNHFIALFCDLIRYMRQEAERPFAEVRT
jgi:hypothetical protein